MRPAIRAWVPEKKVRAFEALLSRVCGRDIPETLEAIAPNEVDSWAQGIVNRVGWVLEVVEIMGDELPDLLASNCPFLFESFDASLCFVVVSSEDGVVEVLDQGGESVAHHVDTAVAVFSAGLWRTARSFAEQALPGATKKVGPASADLYAFLAQTETVGRAYILRENHAITTRKAIKSVGLPLGLALIGASALVGTAVTSLAWTLIGTITLEGHADRSRLLGWGVLSLTALGLEVATIAFGGALAIRLGAKLRERLLEGALRLEPDAVSKFGLGGLTVMASQADTILNSVVHVLMSGLALSMSALATYFLLFAAPLSSVTAPLFTLALVVGAFLAVRRLSLARVDQGERVRLATELAEKMLGHRTRLAQLDERTWHEGEDESLSRYARNLDRLDRNQTALQMVSRVYTTISILVLAFVLVSSPTQHSLALSLGAMASGGAALRSLAEFGITVSFLRARWDSLSSMLVERLDDTVLDLGTVGGLRSEGGPVLEARGLSFSYPGRTERVLEGVNLSIGRGSRVLIEGTSGSGKTTLVALLARLRKPDSGLIMVNGLDKSAFTEYDFRRVIASAPQFYKNHIFSGTLGFNLMMGRSWPASEEDTEEATRICEALGLGPLLARMPSGLFQQVGETGWQLSHGEKSRIYLARTLLQRSEVVILDETFGTLDPSTLVQCMNVVQEEAKTLVVITHR